MKRVITKIVETKSVWILLGLLFIVGCQRSPQVRPDAEQPPVPTASGGYYSNQGTAEPKISIGQLKKKIAIYDFWNDTPAKQSNYGSFIATELKQSLLNTRRALVWPPVVEGDEGIKPNANTEDFIHGDQIRVAQLLKEGRRLGVAMIVIGRIKRITFRQNGDEVGIFRQKHSAAAVELESKFFDVQGSREVASITRVGETASNNLALLEGISASGTALRIELTQNAIRDTVGSLTSEILQALEKITWHGHIAKSIGPKVYVSSGKDSGLNLGDILKVTNQGQEVYDPMSGALLGRSKGLLKGTLEIVDFLGTDGAVAEVHTGGNFKEGDLVELY